MTLLWVWLWCLTAMGAPSLVWQEYTAEPERWQNRETSGLIVLPFIQSSIAQGPTPFVWEVQSMNGKPQRVSIACSVRDHVLYQTEVVVETSTKGSAVIPLQGVSTYDNLTCTVKDTQKRVLTTLMTLSVSSAGYAINPTLFIDSGPSREYFPEWMIATELERQEGVFVQVPETKWLPTDFTAYMGMQSVVWFPTERKLSPTQESALVKWVRFGGHLIVAGDPNFQTSKTWSALLEERFNFDALGEDLFSMGSVKTGMRALKTEYSIDQMKQFQSLVGFEYDGVSDTTAYRVGRGRVSLVTTSISVQEAFALITHTESNQTGFFSNFLFEPSTNQVRMTDASPHPFFNDSEYNLKQFFKSLDIFELVPESIITLLIAVFAILIGPVNLSLRGRRIHLIWRTPLLAMLCTVIVLMVNWAYTTSARGYSFEFATWDANSNDLMVRKERVYFANSNRLETLPLQANTRLLPIRPEQENAATLSETSSGSEWVNISKLRQVQSVLSWHTIQQRRGIRVENGTVYNDLDVSIRKLMHRDEAGNYWVSPELSAGSSAQLVKASTGFNLQNFFPDLWVKNGMVSAYWTNMPNNTVVFLMEDKVTWDGLEASNGDFDLIDGAISDFHTVVYGVLP